MPGRAVAFCPPGMDARRNGPTDAAKRPPLTHSGGRIPQTRNFVPPRA